MKLMAICALFMGVWCNNSYAANEILMIQNPSVVGGDVEVFNLINWTVGDTATFDVTLGAFGKVGTMVKTVTQSVDAQNAIWVKTNMNLSIQKDESEMLLSRADGKILKFIHNGKEEAVPDNDIEIVSQDYTEITVPAGTFKAVHIVANTKDVKGIEVWVNPRDTIMEGTLKQTMPTQFGTVEIALSKFKHGDSLHTFPWPCGDFVPCH